MKQFCITMVALLAVVNVYAQDLFFTRNGHINFFSSTPMEDIKAVNDKVTSVINTSTGEIEFSVLINAFQFEKALMQEHFNENYMESTEFPKATFKGNITNVKDINFTADGTYSADVTGDLTIHGVTKKITTTGKFLVKAGSISSEANFQVKPEDYKIEIPGIVRDKIAKEIKVSVASTYQPYKR